MLLKIYQIFYKYIIQINDFYLMSNLTQFQMAELIWRQN